MNEGAFWKSFWALIVFAFFGILFFCYKADTCGVGPGCHEVVKKADEQHTVNCDVGATMEVQNNGWVICRCPKETTK